MHPRCTHERIWQDNFADKTSRYVSTLLHENRDYIHKTESADSNVATEFQIRVKQLSQVIDLQHYVTTGQFKAKWVQAEIPYTDLAQVMRNELGTNQQ
jgi:hypothetical protein